ncbi:protein of unknown function [Petrocella atlantisensis]|uniref:Uncharacterized protein n=1 Tax=Petrocella atlantisensis TaxID=2173034 RepID=A0A3P7RVD4_9FIRM|nr:protein of unknown function [Petrocella atlantisensis]
MKIGKRFSVNCKTFMLNLFILLKEIIMLDNFSINKLQD